MMCLSQFSQNLLKTTKLPSKHSMLGRHRHASKTQFKWGFAAGPAYTGIWILPHLINYKKPDNVKIGPPSPWQNFLDTHMNICILC